MDPELVAQIAGAGWVQPRQIAESVVGLVMQQPAALDADPAVAARRTVELAAELLGPIRVEQKVSRMSLLDYGCLAPS